MAKGEFVSFMYHEFQTPGRVPSRSNPGYMRYVVSASMFAKQLAAMRSDGYTGCCVTEAFKGSDGAVAITIDDSNMTDLEVAAPILCEYGFRATFFAVASWINSHNHLTSRDLRTLVSMGMEIGSHSLTHCTISHMPLPEMRREQA